MSLKGEYKQPLTLPLLCSKHLGAYMYMIFLQSLSGSPNCSQRTPLFLIQGPATVFILRRIVQEFLTICFYRNIRFFSHATVWFLSIMRVIQLKGIGYNSLKGHYLHVLIWSIFNFYYVFYGGRYFYSISMDE